MEQLTMQDIVNLAIKLKREGLDLSKIPIYLGNDDELNGIHNGWYCELIDSEDKSEDSQYLIDLINEDCLTASLNGKGVLIS